MGHWMAPGHLPFAGAAVVVDAFLVRHPSGPVLLDTGIGVGMPEVEAMYKPVRWPLDEVLRDAGVSVGEIRVVANCHMHFDHSGNNFRFPRVPILAQKVEREAVATPNYTLPGPVAEFDGARFELLEGEADIVPGVRIVPTPGHTAGHQALVVETAGGPVLLAGQAFTTASEFGFAAFSHRLATDGLDTIGESPAWMARIAKLDPIRTYFAHDLLVHERDATTLGIPQRL